MSIEPTPVAESGADPEPIGRCEWCPEKVFIDQGYLTSSGYLWHTECAERCLNLLEAGTWHEERTDG